MILPVNRGRLSLSLIVLCQVGGMALWFSASAAVPGLLASGAIDADHAGMMTGAVQLGYVAGSLASAVFGLADRAESRLLFAAAAIFGGAANAGLLVTGYADPAAIGLRFLTGFFLAGVYPVGLKMSMTWASGNMGTITGILVGALTLGSALPNLFTWLGDVDWRTTVVASSGCAMAAAAMILLVQPGPGERRPSHFRPRQALKLLRRPSVILANLGYLGHMWELYAMWAWIGSFFFWALAREGIADAARIAALLTFIVIGSGTLGCIAGGMLADRFGRTIVTIVAMVTSGLCAAGIGLSADVGITLAVAVAVVWGITVIADSAQFSSAIAELSEPDLVGTMLTIQTCLGFLLTFASIQLMSVFIDVAGWRYAFAFLAVGPALGVIAMWRLRSQPDSVCIAGGRR